MNKNDIGYMAGKIWHLLDDEGELSITEIHDKLDVSEPLLYSAIGWLCREDKIHCSEEEGKLILSQNVPNGFFG
jgi:hypothetical protein